MKDKKAFTLIELLAVIVILGVLATLIIPKVVTSLDESEKSSNLTSAKNLVKAAEYKASNNSLEGKQETIVIDFQTHQNVDYLDYSGQKPKEGQIIIKSDGKVAMAVKIGKNCYTKTYNSSDINTIEYNSETCGKNATVFVDHNMPELAISGDGLYQSQDNPDRFIYKGENPDNYINIKENGVNVTYRIYSYEPDGTIKVVRDSSIGYMPYDDAGRQNTSDGYYCTGNGCNAWGNRTNTYYNGKTLSSQSQDFYFYYYADKDATTLSSKPGNNYGNVTENASLNTYLNSTFYNTLTDKTKLVEHPYNVGGVYYHNYNEGYTGGDKGISKEKQEEQLYTWNGKVALLTATEIVETSLSDTCTDVYSNYYYQPNNVNYANSTYTAVHQDGNWPCSLKNWNYKTFNQWTLTAYPQTNITIWIMNSLGYFAYYYYNTSNNTFGVRPTFYLNSTTKLGGLGTQENPYYILP